MSLVALSLLVFLVAVGGSIAFLVTRGIALWRDFRAFSRALGGELAAYADSLERLAEREPPDAEQLSLALARMRSSQERLSLLTGALGRVQGQWAGLLAIYPKK